MKGAVIEEANLLAMDGGTPPGGAPVVASDDDSATVAYILPNGLGIVILVFSIFFSVMSLLVVSLRFWIRARGHILGLDDGLMGVGLLFFLVSTGLSSYATFEGLAAPVDVVDSKMKVVGQKVSSKYWDRELVVHR